MNRFEGLSLTPTEYRRRSPHDSPVNRPVEGPKGSVSPGNEPPHLPLGSLGPRHDARMFTDKLAVLRRAFRRKSH